MDEKTAAQRSKQVFIALAIAFVIAGILLGIGIVLNSKTVEAEPEYVAKSLKYPYSYPIEDAPMITSYSYPPLFISIGISAFFSTVCYGFYAIISLSEENGKKDSTEG